MAEGGAISRANSPARPPKPCRERAVGRVALWQHAKSACVEGGWRHRAIRRRLEHPLRVLGQKALYLRVVLFWLERAGAVDHEPAGAHDGSRGTNDRALERAHDGEVRYLESPARIGMTPERSCARA